MGDIVLAGATSGTITLQPTAVAGSNTLTLPAANATVLTSTSPSSDLPSSINGPAFSAYSGAATSIANASFTKVLFDTEEFDTNSNFASSRFTPTVAGYYQINAGVGLPYSTAIISIFKNGSEYKRGTQNGSGAYAPGLTVASVVYFNGSTDYVEIYAYQASGSAQNNSSGSQTSYFNGAMVRAA